MNEILIKNIKEVEWLLKIGLLFIEVVKCLKE